MSCQKHPFTRSSRHLLFPSVSSSSSGDIPATKKAKRQVTVQCFFLCCTAVLQDVVREITVKTPFKQLVKLLGVNVYKTLILRLYGIIMFWRCVTTHKFSLYTLQRRKMALTAIIKSTQKGESFVLYTCISSKSSLLLAVCYSYIAKMLLLYFPDEESVSVVKESSLVNNIEELEQGSLCCVKERGKVYNGVVVEVGKSSSVAMFCFIIILYNNIYIYNYCYRSHGQTISRYRQLKWCCNAGKRCQ